MITREQAMTATAFHYGPACQKTVGPRGGVTFRIERFRRNGATQTWKTRPTEFRVPVKYGMREYGNITQHDVANWHVAGECPIEEMRY